MALEIKLNQKLSQTLVMTPQLQQAIKLLQLGRMEYLEVIERELLENPFLEDAREGTEIPTDRALESTPGMNDAPDNPIGEFIDPDFDSASVPLDTIDAGTANRLNEMEYDSGGEQFAEGFGKGRRNDFDGERPSVEGIACSSEGLASHLLWQLRTNELSAEDQRIALQIVGNLDRNGYLCAAIEEIAELCPAAVEDVERVLPIVQSLDPSGIAARDLKECLMIQLDHLGMRGSVAWQVVESHLPDLELRRYEVVSKSLKVTVDEVYEAIRCIQRLEPRPGRPFVDDAPVYITPDVYVKKVGDEYIVSLNDNGIPKLRLSPRYQELLQKAAGVRVLPDREYLQDRVRSASWLIKSIHQRQQTIYKVTESIMRHQREFLEHGISALRPLVLKDISQDVGMHESTISRVTTNKYVHTPQGVFELKFFFTSGLKSNEGEVSSESVKDRIRDLVAKEDQKKPLSDQAIVQLLRAEGVDIARRTVAKYREMMNILSSSRRKKVF